MDDGLMMASQQQRAGGTFEIMTSYERLDTPRKLILCDQIVHEDDVVFERTAKLLWPKAKTRDVDQLKAHLANITGRPQ